ncbi:MAG: anthrone oxygenase family protein [Pseudomonadota bacterium]
MSLWIIFALQIIVLAYATVGGVFVAFSDFIMRSLALSAQGSVTMQVINREVFRWIFMVLFLGLAPVSLAMALYGLNVVGGQTGTLMAAAGLIYVIGCFGVTVCFNVPMNNALAALQPGTGDIESYWSSTYLPRWTYWNSVRAFACVLAAGVLAAALTLSFRLPV